MMSLTGIRGFSDPNGSWKMICIFAPQRPQLVLADFVMSLAARR